MANWDSYTQKATPEDADTLMIKDTAGAANKRTPFSGVWNWMVNKLTSAVISQLETTNKSIVPAINELNSKKLSMYGYAINFSGNTVSSYIINGSDTYQFYFLFGQKGIYGSFNAMNESEPQSNFVDPYSMGITVEHISEDGKKLKISGKNSTKVCIISFSEFNMTLDESQN